MDLFEWQKLAYLIIVEYYSRFIKIAKLDRATAASAVVLNRPAVLQMSFPTAPKNE